MKPKECDICKTIITKHKDRVRIGKTIYCKKCYRENKKNNRQVIKNLMKIPTNPKPLIIKTQKPKKNNLNSKDKKILFSLLYKHFGEDEARKRLRNLDNYERNLFSKMINEHKDKINLNKRFKEAFNKLQ